MKKQDAFTTNTILEYINNSHNTPKLSHHLNALLRRCIPHHCLLCKSTAQDYLCTPCTHDLPWLTPLTCIQCSLPFIQDPSLRTSNYDVNLCGECLTKPPNFDKTICAFTYEFPLNDMIHQFKDHTNIATGKFLTEQLRTYIRYAYKDEPLPQCIIAVPMHWKKLLQRGFNQADVISHHLSKALGVKMIQPIKKCAPTANQHQLNRQQRQHNLQNSFILTEKSHATLAGINHIAVVDDVVTTGATANTLASILKTAGVNKVDVWALARTPSPTTK